MSDDRLGVFQALIPSEARALHALMSRIVPHEHPALREVVWATALSYDAQLVSHGALRDEVRENLRDLDVRARNHQSASFVDASDAVQDAILKEIEASVFFQTMVSATISDFYNRHAVWHVIGYPGVDQRDGTGYLHKAFDTLSWD